MRVLKNVWGCWGLGLGLLAAWPAQAGQYQLLLGQVRTVPIAVPVRNHETRCHLQLQVAGQPPVEQVVSAPLFEARLAIQPDQPGPLRVRWIGSAKRVNGELVNPCPSEGQTELYVASGSEDLVANWNQLYARLGPALTACVRTALDVQQVRWEWYDLRAPQSSAEDAKIRAALQQCEAFHARSTAWGNKDPERHACVLATGVKSQCEGYYAVPGKTAQVISYKEAIARQLQGQPWTTGVRETAPARAGRLKREQAEQQRREAEAAAEVQAQAKREQDEEAKRQAEAKALAEQAEAERAREAEQKEKEEKERLENRSWFSKTYDGIKQKFRGEGK